MFYFIFFMNKNFFALEFCIFFKAIRSRVSNKATRGGAQHNEALLVTSDLVTWHSLVDGATVVKKRFVNIIEIIRKKG